MTKKNFTNAELLALEAGTLVKIKDRVDCASIYKKGGKLIFQREKEMEDNERPFGIQIMGSVCFSFSCNDYELADKIIPLNEEEMEMVTHDLRLNPKWIKAEKEEDARTLIQWFCEDYGATFQQIQHYQFRVARENLKVDIFPLTKKFHGISQNTRGTYKDLTSFLMNYFNIPLT